MKLELAKVRTTVEVAGTFASDGKLNTVWSFGYVEVKGNKGRIITTNGDMGFEAPFEVKENDVKEDIKFLIPMDRFKNLIKDFPQDEMSLQFDDKNQIIIKGKKLKYTLPTMKAEDFSFLTLEKAINKFSVPSAKLADAFERVKLCIASDRGENAVFKCAYLSIDEEGSQADIVSTDKRRVGYYRLPKEDGLKSKGGKVSALIPEFIVSNILPLLKNYSLDVQIAVNDKTIEFTFANGFVITSRLVDGKFPEWNKLISLNMNEHSMTVIKNDLLNALKRCEGVLKDNIVKIEFDEKNITITGAEADRGSCEEHVDIINKDKFKNSFFYNLVYLMDGLKVANTDEVVLRVSESNKPLGVKELHGNENYIYAMMAITSK